MNKTIVWRGPPVLVALLGLCTAPTAFGDQANTCPGGWLSVQAEILRILPANTKLERRSGSHSDKVGVDAVLCAGDVLIVPDKTTVEIYEAGRTSTHSSNYTVKASSGALASKAAQYLKVALSLVNPQPPAARPTSTSIRGFSPSAAAGAAGLFATNSLRDLPKQSLVANLSPITSWRDGAPTFRCDVVDDDLNVLWSSEELNRTWCEYGKLPGQAARLRVHDLRRRSLGWNISVVEWPQVPRPEWVAGTANASLPIPDLSAWGIWLWENGGTPWRMQSLAMLNKASDSQWLARYFLDHVLDESPPIRPKE
jgi:hypothetical protein